MFIAFLFILIFFAQLFSLPPTKSPLCAKAIVLIDTKHHPEQILDLAVMFNNNNLKGINIMYRTAKDNNWPEEFDDELEMHIKFNDYNIKECFPKYVLSKKDYKKFEEVMQNALLGKFGEYKGV